MPTNAIVKKSALWNPWHGCHKLSEGCRHCYVYRGDAHREVDSSVVTQTKSFDVPVRRKRNGEYKIPSGTLVYTCCTVENQSRADYRLPIYHAAPIRHKIMICEPLLERIDLAPFRIGEWVEQVVVGGESGNDVRPCDFDWVMALREVCAKGGVSFWFKQTGAKFIKEGRLYHIKRQFQHSQARKAGINL